MKLLGRLILVVAIIAGACAWVMYNGHWPGVVSFAEATLGKESAQQIDEFGKGSKAVGDEVIDYGNSLHEEYKATGTVKPDWDALKDALGGFGKQAGERHPDYDRAAFGNGWLDPDGNRCDTRNDVLSRDLTNRVTDAGGCTVLSGTLADPYTSKSIAFQRGAATSAAVQIDHIVPLAAAWDAGAWKWSAQTREAFANDPANLLAVDGPTNSGKGAKTLSQWMPPETGFHCTYVALYVAVIDKYDLAMLDQDKVVAQEKVSACG